MHNKKSQKLRTLQRIMIDIRPLKALVLENFPPNSPLRITLLAERDVLELNEYLAKLETWLNILKGERIK